MRAALTFDPGCVSGVAGVRVPVDLAGQCSDGKQPHLTQAHAPRVSFWNVGQIGCVLVENPSVTSCYLKAVRVRPGPPHGPSGPASASPLHASSILLLALKLHCVGLCVSFPPTSVPPALGLVRERLLGTRRSDVFSFEEPSLIAL